MKNGGKEFTFNTRDFRFISKLVGEKTGIVLAEKKRDMVYGRIARRLRALKMKKFKEYCELLKSDEGEEEIVDFVNAITTNLTKFFRESHHFDHLAKEVLTPLITKPTVGKRFRIWSAGCSSGMEAYSTAMTACSTIPNIESWNLKILATDIDTNMLNKGIEGIYRKDDVLTVPDAYRKKYVRHGEAGSSEVVMSDDIKKLISFKHLNFMERWPVKGPFDVVLCRNVVIYFDKDTQRVLFEKFSNVMRVGGWLYIGHSENITALTDKFELVGKTIYRKVK